MTHKLKLSRNGRAIEECRWICLASLRGLATHGEDTAGCEYHVTYGWAAGITERRKDQGWEYMQECADALGLPMPERVADGARLVWPLDISSAHALRSLGIVRQFMDSSGAQDERIVRYAGLRELGMTPSAAFLMLPQCSRMSASDEDGKHAWYSPSYLSGHTINYGLSVGQPLGSRPALPHIMLFSLPLLSTLEHSPATRKYVLSSTRDDVVEAMIDQYNTWLPQQRALLNRCAFSHGYAIPHTNTLAWYSLYDLIRQDTIIAGEAVLTNNRKKAA